MRIDLLPQKMNFKANLHTHSCLSDGRLRPEELAALYYEHGYQVLAITDHEFFVDHSSLNREGFLLLTGYELQIVDESVRPRRKDQKCCHLCLISKDPHEFRHVYFNPDSYDLRRLCHIPEKIPEMKSAGIRPLQKQYSREIIREVVRTAVENNLLVAFNHPVWSLENHYESYRYLDGIYAMEIYNNDSVMDGLEEYNPGIYDLMLQEGMHAGCIATDDAHAARPLSDPLCDLFGGWTMIRAEELRYDCIIRALEQGDFYATTGPEIYELYYDGEEIRVSTSDAQSISLTTGGRRGEKRCAASGSVLNRASFRIGQEDQFIRVTVKDGAGHTANSRGYFLEEFYQA